MTPVSNKARHHIMQNTLVTILLSLNWSVWKEIKRLEQPEINFKWIKEYIAEF